MPVCGTTFAELVFESKSVEDALGLIDATTHVGVADGHVPDDALWVDDEEGALGDALVFDQDAVVAAEFMVAVADERDVDASEAAF